MPIRPAVSKDVPKILDLLSQVLELHARLRPDLFVPGTTKYTAAEVEAILADAQTPVWVAVNGADEAVGYAFCRICEPPPSNVRTPRKTMFIDDLCVDEACRGGGIGTALFRHVLKEAERRGCADVTLNVWEENVSARRFYEGLGMRPRETQMEYDLRAGEPANTEGNGR